MGPELLQAGPNARLRAVGLSEVCHAGCRGRKSGRHGRDTLVVSFSLFQISVLPLVSVFGGLDGEVAGSYNIAFWKVTAICR